MRGAFGLLWHGTGRQWRGWSSPRLIMYEIMHDAWRFVDEPRCVTEMFRAPSSASARHVVLFRVLQV